VAEQLEYFANLKGMKKREIEEEIDRVLEMVNLEEQRNVKGRKLSGGMIRRLGIGQAIMNHPKLVVFDEPTVGLDPEERLRFKRILHEVGKDCTILMSTHIVEDVESSCDKILILNRGRLVASGTQTEISAYAENRIYECSTDEVNQEDYIIKEFRRGEERMCRILSYQASEETTEKSSSVYRIPVTPTVEDGYLYILRYDKKHEK
jgi:ABC-2 type transport system ATP-binding protein